MTEMQTTFQNKKRTRFNKICHFNKNLLYLLYCKDMVKLSYIKTIQKQLFADVLQNRRS